jgi:hypothetical protein
MTVGDKVMVTLLKNGYWKGELSGTVVKVTEKRITVRTKKGTRAYSPANVWKTEA